MLWTSNNSLQVGDMGIRSPFARVRVLLSSKTEFRFSIQIASTGPSKTRNTFSPGEKNKTKQKQTMKRAIVRILKEQAYCKFYCLHRFSLL